jgi:hypothetical protein
LINQIQSHMFAEKYGAGVNKKKRVKIRGWTLFF